MEETDSTDSVGIGSIVTVRDLEFDEEDTYRIVGSQEANPMQGRISESSPFGAALLGHKAGEIVSVSAPGGVEKFEILKIERE